MTCNMAESDTLWTLDLAKELYLMQYGGPATDWYYHYLRDKTSYFCFVAELAKHFDRDASQMLSVLIDLSSDL